MKTIQERLKDKNIDDSTKYHTYNYLYKAFQEIALNIGKDAYVAGYEKRVCDQLDAALIGNPIGTWYNQSELDEKVRTYIVKLNASTGE